MIRPLLIPLLWTLSLAPVRAERLGYHEIRTDADGRIVPWFSAGSGSGDPSYADPGASYDHVIRLVWNFWKNMETCPNGVPYRFQHQVWAPGHDKRGLGGDQLAMALSSWSLLYAYTGDRSVVDEMTRIADYYLDHGLSGPGDAWPRLPFPYNTDVHSGVYDGDMIAGKGYLQPDKAGSFGIELVTLHQITGRARYLDAAVAIADALADKVAAGDGDASPLPFRVHAQTGKVADAYTTNWTGTLRLWEALIRLKRGRTDAYARARETIAAWLKRFPLKTNKWGPFFEDIKGWSNTQINADTLAWYVLEHPEWDADWKRDARAILDWTAATFGNSGWSRYGVTPINEQTVYLAPGNSHTSRHASVELLYAERTGDVSRKLAAVRQLHWATYMVDDDGKNRYPKDNIWLTDGYGDYVRHYLRSMAAAPDLAPAGQNHILRATSAIKTVAYGERAVTYETAEASSREVLRLGFTPVRVTAGGTELARLTRAEDLDARPGYVFDAVGDAPGVLRIRHDEGGAVSIAGREGKR